MAQNILICTKYLMLAICCTAILAINPNRVNRQVSVEIEQSEWRNLFDQFSESSKKQPSEDEEKIRIQMILMEQEEVNEPEANEDNEDNNSAVVVADGFTSEENLDAIEEFASFNEFDELTATNLFQQFQIAYDRNYADDDERQARYQIFKQSLQTIDELNRNEQGTAWYGVGEFADYSETEFQEHMGLRTGRGFQNFSNITAKIPDVELPDAFDWRSKNVVAPPKNQGQCGSCWAFSTVGNIESLNAIRTGHLETLSEQELVDCDNRDGGCNGGIAQQAVEEIHRLGGLVSDQDYPYHGRREQCKFSAQKVRVRVSKPISLPQNEDEIAKYLVEHGPVSICLNAKLMQHYRGGVAHPSQQQCPPRINHGVLAVGIGQDQLRCGRKVPHWILKNSWGTGWGDNGYYKLYRGDNSCGIRNQASSTILA